MELSNAETVHSLGFTTLESYFASLAQKIVVINQP